MSLLSLSDVSVAYDGAVALHGCSLEVRSGTIVTLLGANGAGKTTMLNGIAGLIPATSGQIRLEGLDITKWSPSRIVKAGLSLVPEHRQLFPEMTVEENLIIGTYVLGLTRKTREAVSEIYDLFPELVAKRNDPAVLLSGGQQQMLAIGRALMGKPRLLMLDEPSLGLAPKLIDRVLNAIVTIHRNGVTILLVEQNAHRTLPISDYSYVLQDGSVAIEGTGSSLMNDKRVQESYLGTL